MQKLKNLYRKIIWFDDKDMSSEMRYKALIETARYGFRHSAYKNDWLWNKIAQIYWDIHACVINVGELCNKNLNT